MNCSPYSRRVKPRHIAVRQSAGGEEEKEKKGGGTQAAGVM